MLVFIVPLQSAAASQDWAHTSRLAVRSINSMLSQTSSSFRVILVCNTRPIGCPVDSRLEIRERDFPLPGLERESRMVDKWAKVAHGLTGLPEYAPCHVMVVDADDCVSNRLAAWCEENPGTAGWYFESGWMRDAGSPLIFKKRAGFYDICGTSSIVRISEEESRDVARDPPRSIICRSGHRKIRANMLERGTPLAPLPFPGSIYNLATGENHSQFSLHGWRSKRVLLEKIISYRLLTGRIRQEFGLVEIEP